MTPQEVFDKVVFGLRAQGRKSERKDEMDGTTVCLYRGPENTKCAAGLLIEDFEYADIMEGTNIKGLLEDWSTDHSNPIAESLSLRLVPHLELIVRLQTIHDISEVKYWEQEFSRVADDFNLVYIAP
jgi:hypothetical protein